MDVEVTPEFSSWFERLSPEQAEEVAAALDLLGANPGADRFADSGDALLFFDGLSRQERALFPSWRRLCPRSVLHGLAPAQIEAIRWLESPRFVQRLWTRHTERIPAVMRAVQRLREHLQRLGGADSPSAPPEAEGDASAVIVTSLGLPLSVLRVLTAGEARLLSQRFTSGSASGPASEPSAASGEPGSKLDALLADVFRRLGVDPSSLEAPRCGVREIVLREVTPALRILYGVHPQSGGVLALAGDILDHSYYGDSIRLAEQRLEEFLARPLEPALPTP